MFLTLFRKECAQTAGSLIYWLYVACLVLFFNSQLGNMDILSPPQQGQEDYAQYGYEQDVSEQDIMEAGTGNLIWAYYYELQQSHCREYFLLQHCRLQSQHYSRW